MNLAVSRVRMRATIAAAAVLCLPGCVARTAWNVATAPVRAASWSVDKLTTSQGEADRNRGRKLRKQEAREAKERRRAEKDARWQAERQSPPTQLQ